MSESTPTPSEGKDKLEGVADGGADGVPGIQDGGADGGADSGADGGAYGESVEALIGAPILVRMWARGRDQISVRTSGRDPVQIVERMLEPDGARTWAPTLVPTPQNPARDSVRGGAAASDESPAAGQGVGAPGTSGGGSGDPVHPRGQRCQWWSRLDGGADVEPGGAFETAVPIVALAETAALTVARTVGLRRRRRRSVRRRRRGPWC